jgi:hypothetical protein
MFGLAAGATRNRPKIAHLHEIGRNLLPWGLMTTTSGAYQIHTEARGPHWIAWITRGGESKPNRSIVLVAASEAEAEERARRWAEQAQY